MKANHQRLLGVVAIACAFAGNARAESQYVVSSITPSSDRTTGIVLNGSEFVMSGTSLGSVAKMEAAGYNEATFTQDWTWKSPITSAHYGNAIAADSLGRIIIAGYNYNSGINFNLAVARLHAVSGTYTLDPTFHSSSCSSGIASGFCDTKLGTNTGSAANAVLVDATNRVVAAGSSGKSGSSTNFAVARYTVGGALDASFNSTGYLVTTIPGYPNSAILGATQDSSGNIVAVGTGNNSNNACLARYKGNGAGLDSSFVGGNGAVSPTAGVVCVPNAVFGATSTTSLNAVTLDAMGNIVATGTMLPLVGHKLVLVARFTPTGALDTTFGSGDGFLTVQPSTLHNVGRAVQIDSGTGEIVVAGYVGGGAGQKWLLLDISPDGSTVDNTNLFTLPGSTTENEATGLILTPGGALMSGLSDALTHGLWDFAAALF